MLDAVPPLKGPRGRPRRRPDKLHADKAYDHKRCRRECRERNIIPRIARRGIEDSKRLGRHRWVVLRRTMLRVSASSGPPWWSDPNWQAGGATPLLSRG